MNLHKTILLVAALTLFSAGCQSEKKTEAPSAPGNAAPLPKEMPESATGPAIPEELKTDAFRYYGLSNSKPLRMQVVRAGADPLSGEQTFTQKEVKPNAAVFTTTRTGSLQDLGMEEVSAEKDGVYVLSSTIGDIGGKSLELPAQLEKGKTWKRLTKVTRSDGTVVSYDAGFKVVGTEKVKTPLGEFDALLITSDGPAQIGTMKTRMMVKSWYVKDLGPVKIISTLTPTSGPAQTMTIEAIK